MVGRCAIGIWLGAAAAFYCATAALARDYGQHGALFPIAEEDLLLVIERRLHEMERSGRLEVLQRQMAEQVKARVFRPDPLPGIKTARRSRTWHFDPSLIVTESIKDHKGRFIARKGMRVNPLDHVRLRQKLVFVDGREDAQVSWALRETAPHTAKLILTAGSALALMRRHRRIFYFDQAGVLTRRLGIAHVPAIVEQDGKRLRVRELPLPTADTDRTGRQS